MTSPRSRRDLLRMALEAVYIDMESGKVVAIKPKPAFLPLFNLDKPATAGSKIIVSGDPDGYRSYHAQWPFVVQVDKADELLWVA